MNYKVRSEKKSLCCRGKISIWVIIFILIIGGVLFWYYFTGQEKEKIIVSEFETKQLPEKEENEFPKLTPEAIRNCEYHFPIYKKTVRLVSGHHEEEEIIDEYGYRYFFSAGIVEDKLAFGDLNYNGREDAAVIVYSTGGGSGIFYELAVIINQNGTPYHLTSEALGDRIRVNSIEIRGGVITLNMLVHDIDDAACCPTLYKTFQYKLSGNELVEI